MPAEVEGQAPVQRRRVVADRQGKKFIVELVGALHVGPVVGAVVKLHDPRRNRRLERVRGVEEIRQCVGVGSGCVHRSDVPRLTDGKRVSLTPISRSPAQGVRKLTVGASAHAREAHGGSPCRLRRHEAETRRS